MNKLTAICRALSLKPATSIELAQTLGKKLIPVRNGLTALREEGYVRSMGAVHHPDWHPGRPGYRYLRVYELTEKGRQRLAGTLPGKPVESYEPAYHNSRCEKCGEIYAYLSKGQVSTYDCGCKPK